MVLPSQLLLLSGSFLILLLVFVVGLLTYLLKKVGPNEALIVFGRRGTRIVVGGSAFVNPITERYRLFSLELMVLEVSPEKQLYTSQGIGVMVEAVAQLKVRSDEPAYIRSAAEQFLSKSQEKRELVLRQLLEGHLRHIVGHLTVEDLVKNTDYVAHQMHESVRPALEKMGLVLVSFTMKHVSDGGIGYIETLGKLPVEALRKQGAVTAIQAQRESDATHASLTVTAHRQQILEQPERLLAQTEEL